VPFGTSPAPCRLPLGRLPLGRPRWARLRWAVPTVLLGATLASVAGAGSAYADTVDPALLPAAPAALTVQPEAGSLAVSWAPPATDGGTAITGYDVAVVPADPTIGTAPVTAYTDAATTATTLSGLANGVDYNVTVSATNSAGAGATAIADGTPRTVPSAVVLTHVSAGDSSATVAWQPPPSDGGAAVEKYVVKALPSGRSVIVAAGVTTARISGLVNGASTTLRVAAVNVAGAGPAVTTAAVTPRKPARLGVAAGPAHLVTYGAATHVTGRLMDSAGRGLVGRRVYLFYRVGTGAYRTAAAGTTGTNGLVALTAKLPATAALVLSHRADAVAAVTTAVGTVRVARRVNEPAPRAILLGRYVTTVGTVAPTRPIGAKVDLMRWVGSRWTVVATGLMTTRSSYRVNWKPTAAGTFSLRVVVPADATHLAGWGRAWGQRVSVETVASIATGILRSTRITLATAHASGVRDNATADDDMLALAAGHWAPRSAYQNAPGGSTPVDIHLLRALRALGSQASVVVSEVAGGSHAVGSSHYRGEAMDISVVNGVSIAAGGNYSLVASVCRSYGATAVYDPAYDPYGGHNNHVHCQWGALSSD
jgi:hypothetical protein